MSEETGIPVYVAENPLDCVIIGTSKELERTDFTEDYFRRLKKYR